MTSFFSRLISTFCLLLFVSIILSGCAQSSAWMDKNGLSNPSSWFGGGNLDQNANASQTSPDISKIHGPLTPPQASPRTPVDVVPLTAEQNAARPQGKVKVAILLPLTGKNAQLGKSMLNAAQLAVFDAAADNFELMPRDTGEGDAGAEMAARDAIASGAQLLIGPLFATSIPAVKAIAQSSNVNMLTLSTDTSMASPGVYVMGFAPGAQVERVVAYAAAHGLHHFAALLPSNAYGSLVGQIFQDAVVKNGGVIVALESYDPQKQDSDAHVRNITLHHDQIDALFLPEGGNDLNEVARQFMVAGLDSQKIRLIGTGLWDVPDLGRQNNFLVSGWYAASDPGSRQAYMSAYKATYGQDAPRLTTLAYDATALAAVLSKRGAKFDTANLTNPNGFAGLDGIFRLTPQGLIERGLALNEVTQNGSRVIEAAPTTFAGY